MENVKDLPFRIDIAQIKLLSKWEHDKFIIMFVISGEVRVSTNGHLWKLKSNDIIVLNVDDIYEIESNVQNIVILLHVPLETVESISYEFSNVEFNLNTADTSINNEEDVKDLRKMLIKMIQIYNDEKNVYVFELYSLFYKFLNHLLIYFYSIDSQILDVPKNEKKLEKILEFINKNYKFQLTLQKVADSQYLSKFYISHLFKDKLGIGFSKYLNDVRMKHGLKELLNTDLPIIKIAYNNGFTNIKSFNRLFKEKYNITPSQYRRENKINFNKNLGQKELKILDFKNREFIQIINKYIMENEFSNELKSNSGKNVVIYAESEKNKINTLYNIINVGKLKELLSYEVRDLLLKSCEETGIDYIYCKVIFDDGFKMEPVFSIDNHYNQKLILEFLYENKFKPLFKIDFISAVNCIKGEKDFLKIVCEKIIAFFKKCRNDFENSWLNTWNVEVSGLSKCEFSQLNIYNEFYNRIFYDIKSILPGIKIGASTITKNSICYSEKLDIFINFTKNKKCVPEFYTFEADVSELLNGDRLNSNDGITKIKNYQKEIILLIKSVMNKNNIKMKNLFMTEWNTLVGKGTTLSGTFFRAALMVDVLKNLENDIIGAGYWLSIYIYEKNTGKVDNSILSLFFYKSVCRPIFFVLKFLRRLGNNVIARGDNYIFTQIDNSYQLMLFNPCYIDPYYSVFSSFTEVKTIDMRVLLKNLKEGSYIIKKFTLDNNNGSFYHKWINSSAIDTNDPEFWNYMSRTVYPTLKITESIIKSSYELNSQLLFNGLQFYELKLVLK